MPHRWFRSYSFITGLIGLFILLFIYFGDLGGGGIFHPLNLVAVFLLFVAYGSYFFRRWVIPLLYINLLFSLAIFVFFVAVSGWTVNAKQGMILLASVLFTLCYFATTLWLIILSRRHRGLFSTHSSGL